MEVVENSSFQTSTEASMNVVDAHERRGRFRGNYKHVK